MTVAEIQTLIAAIEAGFLEEQVWRQWSEHTLLKISPVPVWLLELYDAENTENALAALYRGWRETHNDGTLLNQTELYLGFLYLRYLADNLSLPKLLLEAGAYSDNANSDNPSCEAFYMLLNEYEGRANSPPYDAETFSKRVEKLFLDYADFAKKQLASLQRGG